MSDGAVAAERGCAHERSHVLDSVFHGHGYATATSRRIFCDRCRLQRWLDVEAALALSQAELGMIPVDAALEIARACRAGEIDFESLGAEFQRTSHSLVPLLRGLHAVCHGTTGEFVHYGATTQDIQDTGQALEMAEVLDEVDRGLESVVRRLILLAIAHRESVMVGRTHAQPALPITFGLKVASWIDELLRQADRVTAMRPRVLVAQLFGGAGTMASFDQYGPELLRCFARRLALGAPVVAWHSSRDRIAEFTTTLAMVAATLARIADEIRTLSRAELGEVAEGWEHGQIGSSTMPHKRNPERSEQVVVLARLARANAMLGLESMIHEHERDARALRIEWVAVADGSHYALAALALVDEILGGLQVNQDRMARYAYDEAEAICSEALMLHLAGRVGKQTAHGLIYDLTQYARSQGVSLRRALPDLPLVAAQLAADDLDRVLDPGRYLGAAHVIVDGMVTAAEQWLAGQNGDARRSVAEGRSPMAPPTNHQPLTLP